MNTTTGAETTRIDVRRGRTFVGKPWGDTRIEPMGRSAEESAAHLRIAVDRYGVDVIRRRLGLLSPRTVRRWLDNGVPVPEWARPHILLMASSLREPVQIELLLDVRERVDPFPVTPEPSPDAPIGDVVYWGRVAARVSCSELARVMGSHPAYIYGVESGSFEPEAPRLRSIAAALGPENPAYPRLIAAATKRALIRNAVCRERARAGWQVRRGRSALSTLKLPERPPRRAPTLGNIGVPREVVRQRAKDTWRKRRLVYGPTGCPDRS